MKINVSIVTVVRNDKEGLIRTYESLKTSISDEIEWIVIDGESIDGSKEFLESLDCINLKWIFESDRNMYDGMNKGIRMSSGTYLLFLNAGDILLTDLKKLNLENEDDDLVFYSIRKIDSNMEQIKWNLPPDFLAHLKKYPSVAHQSTFIKKTVFNKVGLYREDFKYLGDYEFFCRVIFNKDYVFTHKTYIDKVIVSFICNGVTFNYRLSLKLMNECERVQKMYFDAIAISTKFMYMSKFILSFIPGNLKIANFMRTFIKH